MPKKIKNAKIAIIDFNLTKQKMGPGIVVNVTEPNKLDAIVQKYAGGGKIWGGGDIQGRLNSLIISLHQGS